MCEEEQKTGEKEIDDLKRLWDSQIKKLRQETGD